MRFLYATLFALAVGLVGNTVQAQPAGNNRPQAPETFTKELVDACRELSSAVKAIPTTIHLQWELGQNAMLSIGAVCATVLLCTVIVIGGVLAAIPRRQA